MTGTDKRRRRPRGTHEEVARAATITTAMTATSDVQAQAKLERRRRIKRQREQERRERSVSKAYNLELDVHDLRQQVHQLTQTRSMLTTRALVRQMDRTDAAVRTVLAYFDAVKNGIPDQNDQLYNHEQVEADPVEFLTAALAKTFTLGPESTGLDADAFIHQWQLYTRLFCVRNVRVDALAVIDAVQEDGGGPVIMTATRWTGVVTRDAILVVFPHVIDNEPLIARVAGKRLVTHGPRLFFFDAHGRIARCDVCLDFFRAFAELLQDPVLVLEVVRDARIGEQSTLGGRVVATATAAAAAGPAHTQQDHDHRSSFSDRDGDLASTAHSGAGTSRRTGLALSLDYILS